jgi:hypothetical protein
MKKGQMNMSFGMIFSIILIVVFLGFAIYAIITFLGTTQYTIAASFFKNLQKDVNDIWQSGMGSSLREYSVPSKATFVCFGDTKASNFNQAQNEFEELTSVFWGGKNVAFYPKSAGEGMDGTVLEKINLASIIEKENPYCVKVVNKKIKLVISMKSGDSLVNITRG